MRFPQNEKRKSISPVNEKRTFTFRTSLLTLLQGILIVAFLSVIVWFGLRYFTVQTIECTEAGRSCAPNVLTFFSGWRNRYIFQDFEFNVPTKRGTVIKKLPHTLVVTIDTPIVVLHVYTDAQKLHSVSVYSDGSVVKDADTSRTADQKVSIIDALITDSASISSTKLEAYQLFLDQAEKLSMTQVTIISDVEIEIQTNRRITAVVSLSSLQAELRSLQLVLTSPTIEQKPARVDFRFERPVLRYL